MEHIDSSQYRAIVFFTGAGMSAESGVPTYRGHGGIWQQYNWETCACQEAFNHDPQKVLAFHELRRKAVLKCEPHAGHRMIADLERQHPNVSIVTQNIDGMHQRGGSHNVIELHGSLWRLRCPFFHGTIKCDGEAAYQQRFCHICKARLRPDIVWFGDSLDAETLDKATKAIEQCDLFISIGTSAVVWPAAGFPQIAKLKGARLIEINPEASALSPLYAETIRKPAGKILPALFAHG